MVDNVDEIIIKITAQYNGIIKKAFEIECFN